MNKLPYRGSKSDFNFFHLIVFLIKVLNFFKVSQTMHFILLGVVISICGIHCQNDIPDPSFHKSWKFLRHDVCGHSSSFRIIGGKNASLGAYPWIARIGYVTKREGKPDFRCGAVIINEKTVLTAAHCVYNLPSDYRVGVVRMGEHYTQTDPDCEDGVCAEPVQDMVPSEIIIHENYDKPLYKNDIAIIRFNKNINFTTYVRPICLLNGTLLDKNYTGSTCEVAGWGIYDINKPTPSETLLMLNTAVVDNEKCAEAFHKYADIDETQMCVGGKLGEDSCGGDSGGPLMKIEDLNKPPRYYLLGIVSFGAKKCGYSQMPGVYTRVSAFIPWILDNLLSSVSRYKRVLL